MPVYYATYWPDLDAVDNCGCPMEIEDFAPGTSLIRGVDGITIDLNDDVRMREATRSMSQEPFGPGDVHSAPEYRAAVCLPIPAVGPGFTYAELRAAATRYRADHQLGCYVNIADAADAGVGPVEDPLCGRPAAPDTGRCIDHA